MLVSGSRVRSGRSRYGDYRFKLTLPLCMLCGKVPVCREVNMEYLPHDHHTASTRSIYQSNTALYGNPENELSSHKPLSILIRRLTYLASRAETTGLRDPRGGQDVLQGFPLDNQVVITTWGLPPDPKSSFGTRLPGLPTPRFFYLWQT